MGRYFARGRDAARFERSTLGCAVVTAARPKEEVIIIRWRERFVSDGNLTLNICNLCFLAFFLSC